MGSRDWRKRWNWLRNVPKFGESGLQHHHVFAECRKNSRKTSYLQAPQRQDQMLVSRLKHHHRHKLLQENYCGRTRRTRHRNSLPQCWHHGRRPFKWFNRRVDWETNRVECTPPSLSLKGYSTAAHRALSPFCSDCDVEHLRFLERPRSQLLLLIKKTSVLHVKIAK